MSEILPFEPRWDQVFYLIAPSFQLLPAIWFPAEPAPKLGIGSAIREVPHIQNQVLSPLRPVTKMLRHRQEQGRNRSKAVRHSTHHQQLSNHRGANGGICNSDDSGGRGNDDNTAGLDSNSRWNMLVVPR